MARPGQLAALAGLALLLAACGGALGSTSPAASVPGASVPAASPSADASESPGTSEPPPGPLELLWESTGQPASDDPLRGTYSPAVHPITGDIWVSAPKQDVIWIFDPDGTYQGSFGEPGHLAGQFNLTRPPSCRPCPGTGGLAFAADGTLFVGDAGNTRVQKFDPNGAFVTEWGGFGGDDGEFADILDVTVAGDEIHVVDDIRADTQVFDLDGRFLRISEFGAVPTLDAAGNRYFSVGKTIEGFRPDGTSFESVPVPDVPGGIRVWFAVADDGRIFINVQDLRTTGALGLLEIDPETSESRMWSTGGETIAIAGDVIYEANYVSEGWPEAVLRAYRLPER
jgi:hypothetical protein